jgi:hypothetical protein
VNNSTPTLKERQANFIGYCFRVLGDDLCKKDEMMIRFYINCISHLTHHDCLTTTQLRDCDKSNEKRDDKTYRNWLKIFRDAIKLERCRLEGELSKYDLTQFPEVVYVTGRKGREAHFYITVSDPGAPEDAASGASIEDEDLDYSKIRYKTEKIQHPPWYLKVAAPLFKYQKSRVIFVLSVLACVFLVVPVGIGYIYFFHMENTLLASLFVVLIVAYLLLASPAVNIIRLLTRKIAILDSIRLPLSSVCISEISRVVKHRAPTTERRLSVVTVSANCPVCNEKYGLENSVQLEQIGLINSRIIGVCINNPMMHQYSFDKDLMTGTRLPGF